MASNDKISKLKAKASATRRSGVDAFLSSADEIKADTAAPDTAHEQPFAPNKNIKAEAVTQAETTNIAAKTVISADDAEKTADESAQKRSRRTKKPVENGMTDAAEKRDRMTVLMSPHIKVYLMLMAKREGVNLTEYVERLILSDYKKKIDPQLTEIINYIVENK